MTTTEISKVKHNPMTVFDNVNPLEFINTMGDVFAKSGMLGVSNPNQGKLLAMACLCERKTPFEITREYHIIEDKLSMRTDAMLAKFKGIGGKYEILQRDENGSQIKLILDGQSYVSKFTWSEAKQESFIYQRDGKTLKKNWATERSRTQMMWARAASDGVRTIAPEVVAGIYTPEEVQDFDDVPAAKKGKSQKPEGEVIDAEFQVEAVKEASPATTGEEVTTPRVQDAHEVAAVVETTASPVEQAPFETTAETAEKPAETVVENPSLRQAMELELAANLVVLEMTEAFCLEQLQKKLPNLKTLDELTDEQFAKVNDRFRKLAQEKN